VRKPIVIPNLGLVEAVTLVEWMFSDGEEVGVGDVVLKIETEKAEVEIQSPATGTLEIAIVDGPDLVPADAVLGYVTESSPES
jgi:pyruvate dehydrogenase E2 component (dihydrolipoamide acetyltransferase)